MQTPSQFYGLMNRAFLYVLHENGEFISIGHGIGKKKKEMRPEEWDCPTNGCWALPNNRILLGIS